MNEQERDFWINQRQALLMQIDAIEAYLGLPRTSEARRYAKEAGWPPECPGTYSHSHDVDVTEAQPE